MTSPVSAPAAAKVTRSRYYLGDGFGVEHVPPAGLGAVQPAAILLLPPLGYEETVSHRPLRVLADALAAEGFLTLRLDWPGLGDGGFDHNTPDLLARNLLEIERTAQGLRDRGFSRVVGLGVRAGGLLGLASPGLDEMVLWGLPLSGKAYLREERAFFKMAEPTEAAGGPQPTTLPEGALEAGGFIYAPQMVKALEALVPAELARARQLKRVLLIDRDGGTPPAKLMDAFAQAGTEATVTPASGLSAVLATSYHSGFPVAVENAIKGWLPRLPGTIGVSPHGQPTTLRLRGGLVERPVVLRGEVGELAGIVCEPEGGAPPSAAWMVFFGAGGIRRSGPNRLWTQAARELASEGRPSLRLDVRGVGDSDASPNPLPDLEEMYSEGSIKDAECAVDWLRAAGAGSVDVAGLCSGAYLAFQISARREIRRAYIFNGLALVWNDEARANGMGVKIGRSILDGNRWRRLLSGKINAAGLAKALAGRTVKVMKRLILRNYTSLSEVEEVLLEGRKRGTEHWVIVSEGDPAITYLETHVAVERRPPMTVIPNVDHTIRPTWAHRRVLDLLHGVKQTL